MYSYIQVMDILKEFLASKDIGFSEKIFESSTGNEGLTELIVCIMCTR
jgi:hypothetical protein